MDVEELAPRMGPAGGFDHKAGLEDGIEAGIAIGMKHAFEALQVSLRMFTLAIGRIEVGCRRWPLSAMGPLVADIGPQPAGLGFAEARSQHRHRRVVTMQHIRSHDLFAQCRYQGIEKCGTTIWAAHAGSP